MRTSLQPILEQTIALAKAAEGRSAPTRGERTLARLFPAGGYGWPGGWSQDRLEQVSHYRHWVFVAVRARCEKFAELQPNLAHVKNLKPRRKQLHSLRYRKALMPIKAHEDLEPVDPDHPLARLIQEPNPVDSWWDLFYETNLFQDLTGNSYWWVIPNRAGLVAEIWCLPAHWVWPRAGRDRLIDHYEIRPWGGLGAQGSLRLPPEEIIHFKDKSPLHKLDGYSAQQAGAQWIDTEESIAASRWANFKHGCRPELFVELGPEFVDPSDDDIARVEAKFLARYGGEYQTGRPLIGGPGLKVTPLGWPMQELGHLQSEEQVRDMILALFRTSKVIAGITVEVNRASMEAAQAGFCTFAINPRLKYYGQTMTRHLARRYDERLRMWWDDTSPVDPQQLNADIDCDARNGAISPNEIRSLRGREGWKKGGDDPLLPMGTAPMPLNTGDDLSGLGALIPTPGKEPGGQDQQRPEDTEGGIPSELPPVKRRKRGKCGGEGGTPGPCPEGGSGDKPPSEKPHKLDASKMPSSPAAAHEQGQEKARGLLARMKSLPGRVVAYATGKAKKAYAKLEAKYGSKWAKAIVAVGIVTLPTPFTTGAVLATCGLAKLCGARPAAGKSAVVMKKLLRAAQRFVDHLVAQADGLELTASEHDRVAAWGDAKS